MARIISQMPASRDTRNRYPWDEWLDGQARILVQAFVAAAHRRGLKGVTAKVSETEIAVQAVAR